MNIYKRFKDFIRRLKYINNTYDQNIKYLEKRVLQAEKIIKERTSIHCDISPSGRSPHQIIVMGRYRNRDYVQAFHIYTDIRGLIEQLREMQRYGEVERMDSPFELKAYIEDELRF